MRYPTGPTSGCQFASRPVPGSTFLPRPPRNAVRLGREVFSMSEQAARAWLASYDEWVDLWNKHERDINLPLSPEWEDAEKISQFRIRSALLFRAREKEVYGFIRMEGFRDFGNELSCLRKKSKPDVIVWGAWSRYHRDNVAPFVEPIPRAVFSVV